MQINIIFGENSSNAMTGFPFREGQYFHETDDQHGYVDLGDATDTTTLQDQFLLTREDVISYTLTGLVACPSCLMPNQALNYKCVNCGQLVDCAAQIDED